MRRLVHEEGKSLVHLLRQIFEGLLLHPLVRPRKVGVQRTTYALLAGGYLTQVELCILNQQDIEAPLRGRGQGVHSDVLM